MEVSAIRKRQLPQINHIDMQKVRASLTTVEEVMAQLLIILEL
jgi:hypothetical protein